MEVFLFFTRLAQYLERFFQEFGSALMAGAIGSAVTYFIAAPNRMRERERLERQRLDNLEKKIDNLIDASLFSYREEIAEKHAKLMKKGYASELEKRNFEEEYKIYIELGGNGERMELMTKEVLNLPYYKEN